MLKQKNGLNNWPLYVILAIGAISIIGACIFCGEPDTECDIPMTTSEMEEVLWYARIFFVAIICFGILIATIFVDPYKKG